MFRSYFCYLLVEIILLALQQGCIGIIIAKNNPIVLERNGESLFQEDLLTIKRNIKAFIIGKISSISVSQTDALIISAAINVGILGRVTNYVTLKTYAFNIVSAVEASAHASMGNLIASSDKETQLHVFYKYMTVCQIVISFMTSFLFLFSEPCVVFLFGESWKVDPYCILFMLLAAMVVNHVYVVNILATCNGRADIIAPYSLLEGMSNLACSILFVGLFELPGVYLGTLVSETIYFCTTPIPIFRKLYGVTPWKFYKRSLKCFVFTGSIIAIVYSLERILFDNKISLLGLGLCFGCFCIAYVLAVILVFGKDIYFREVAEIALYYLRKRIKKYE